LKDSRYAAAGVDIDAKAAALAETTDRLDSSGPPHVLVARTRFGKGVSFMEGKIKWHYWPMSDEASGVADPLDASGLP
jgi:transketolase